MSLPPFTTGDVTASDPEGDPPYPVHSHILDLVTSGELDPDFLDMFYEGFLAYDVDRDSVMITRRGRAQFEELKKQGYL
jgi:hypothetical protein